ncbi:MAG TPA: sodium:solute symporter [Candidatus Baltobacteraceae bacterium]
MSSGAIVFLVLVGAVTVMGFAAAGWGRANLASFEEWALGGRHFGTLVTWFLMGGDLYTAYTFIAVPALVYGAGAIGFFAVPYATIAYPIVFIVLARFWVVAKKRGYITTADFVRDRYGDRSLELAVAVTGVLAAMPYIALQLVGMKTVFVQLGGIFAAHDSIVALVVSFVLLGAYTYNSGLRAPALIAFVKDGLIYLTVIAAIVVIPAKLGGWAHIFHTVAPVLAARPKPSSIVLAPSGYFAYASMAFASALSLFIYPHSITSLLAAKSKLVIQRNAALLPAYSLVLGLLALLGYCAIAAGIGGKDTSAIVPQLFAHFFPDWFAGVAYAAIVIGALVPAAIMAIGAANLFASNIFKQFSPNRPQGETRIAKLLCLAMCVFALIFVAFVKVAYAIDFQLLGGSWMLQVFPALIFGLYTGWFRPKALLIGWFCGMATATAMSLSTVAQTGTIVTAFPLHILGTTLVGFVAFYALLINVAVAAALTWLFGAARIDRSVDSTTAADYT